MTRNEKALGLPFYWVAEVFGAGHRGFHGVTLGSVSASAGGCCASLATGDPCGNECVREVGAISRRMRKLGLSRAEIIDSKLSGG